MLVSNCQISSSASSEGCIIPYPNKGIWLFCVFCWLFGFVFFFGGARILLTSYSHAMNKSRSSAINSWKNIWKISPQKFSPPDTEAVCHTQTRYKYTRTVNSFLMRHSMGGRRLKLKPFFPWPHATSLSSRAVWKLPEYEILIGRYSHCTWRFKLRSYFRDLSHSFWIKILFWTWETISFWTFYQK